MADDSRNADVGARYAQALFELADEAGEIAAVEADLNGLDALRRDMASRFSRKAPAAKTPADVL